MIHFETNWKSNDGLTLYAQGWEPEAIPFKAVVCLVHGIGEHSGRYAHEAEAFAKEGYALFTTDLRGHGKSEGIQGHASSIEVLMQDVDLLLKQASVRYPGLPMILYGHSLGGILALHYGLKRKPVVKGVLVTSPALHSSLEQQAIKVLAAKILGALVPKMTLASGLNVNAISHDLEVIKAYNNDPLVHDRISVGLGKVLLQVCKYNLDHAGEFSLPLLLMHGSADAIAFPSSSIEFWRALASKHDILIQNQNALEVRREVIQFSKPLEGKCSLVLWEGGFHELHNEPVKLKVFKTMTDWMDAL